MVYRVFLVFVIPILLQPIILQFDQVFGFSSKPDVLPPNMSQAPLFKCQAKHFALKNKRNLLEDFEILQMNQFQHHT